MGEVRPQSGTIRDGLIPHRWTRVEDPGSVAVVAAYEAIIAGGGPAGLTAAYELSKHGKPCVVLEADPRMVGGISRTDEYKGFRFDIGGHRFFSKSAEINRLWREILGDEFLTRDRLSRIYYNNKFFHYPLKPVDALWKLGFVASCRIVVSYLKARMRPIRPERTYEDWVVNRFGRELFQTFFKSYTEKVWGTPTNEISPDWAAQRIKDLDLVRAVTSALFGRFASRKGEVIKTLIDRFEYPRLGPGQMWEVARDRVREFGGAVNLDRRVVRIEHDGSAVSAFVASDGEGRRFRYEGRDFLSTLPVRELIRAMSPQPPAEVVRAAESLKYRDFLTVVLIVDRAETFPDNWIYIHEPASRWAGSRTSRTGRRTWSPIPRRPAWGWSISASKGTTCGHPRRRARRARSAGDPGDRAGQVVRGHRRVRGPDAQGLPRLRRRLPGPPGRDPRLAQDAFQPRARRPQRHAQVQQPGSFDDDRPAGGAEHPRPGLVRHVEGQHRRRVSRRGRRGCLRRPRRAAVRRGGLIVADRPATRSSGTDAAPFG